MFGIIYTLTEAAAYLRLDGKTAAALAASGAIKGVKIGGRWRFTSDDLDRYEANVRRAQQDASALPIVPPPKPRYAHYNPWLMQDA